MQTYSKSDTVYSLYKREKTHATHSAKEKEPVSIPVPSSAQTDDNNGKEDVISFEDITIRFTPAKKLKAEPSISPAMAQSQSTEYRKSDINFGDASPAHSVSSTIRREPIARPVRFRKQPNRKKKSEADRLKHAILNDESSTFETTQPSVKAAQFQNQS